MPRKPEMTLWKSFRYEYDAEGLLLYRARHHTENASEDSMKWDVEKFVYDENGNITQRVTRKWSWAGRANI